MSFQNSFFSTIEKKIVCFSSVLLVIAFSFENAAASASVSYLNQDSNLAKETDHTANETFQVEYFGHEKPCFYEEFQQNPKKDKICINIPSRTKRAINIGLVTSPQHVDQEGHYMSSAKNDSNIEAATILVTNATELMDALSNAKGGEVISLAPGDYGELNLHGVKSPGQFSYADAVTIKSANDDASASFSGLDLYEVHGLKFENVTFDYSYEQEHTFREKPFSVISSSDITFEGSSFHGDIAQDHPDEAYDGYAYAIGLWVRESSDIAVTNSEFKDFYRGAVFSQTENISATGNDVFDMSSDGFNFAEVQNVLIANNHFHDFDKPDQSPAHMDMIQFWTAGTDSPSTDIVIRDNFFDNGSGHWTQTIFMRNEVVDRGEAGEEMYYSNILIENNVIYNSHANAISVGEGDGISIQNNTLLHNDENWDDGLINVPTIRIADDSTRVNVTNNIVPWLDGSDNSDHVFSENVIVQNDNPNGENYYGDVFVDALSGGAATLESLQIRPGSGLEGHGAAQSQFTIAEGAGSGFIDADVKGGLNSLSVDFDLSYLADAASGLDLSDATVTWVFEDGSTATGMQSSHTFASGGRQSVSAELSWPDGTSVTLHKTVEVASPLLLDLKIDQEPQDKSDVENVISLSDEVALEEALGQTGIRLNGGTLTVDATADFFNNSEYTFAFDFLREPGSGNARLVNFVNSFVVFMSDDQVTVAVTIGEEDYWIKAPVNSLNNGEWQNLTLTYSDKTDDLRLYMNGDEIASISDLPTSGQGHDASRDLTFGDPYEKTAFDGLVGNAVFISGALSADQVKTYVDENDLADLASTGDNVGETEDPAPQDDEVSTPTETPQDEPEDVSDEASSDVDPIDPTIGGAEDEVFKGTGEADVIYAGSGNDKVWAGDGNDQLFGEDGDDMLAGKDGDDYLAGGKGADQLYGGAGDDVFLFSQDDVRIDGGTGFDTIKIEESVAEINSYETMVYGIDLIDAEDGQFSTITLGHKLIDQADDGVLRINGDTGDKLILVDNHGLKVIDENIEIDGKIYISIESTRYKQKSVVLVDSDISVYSNEGEYVAGSAESLDIFA
ncbi:MAG: right-handed parallel beta-helix repeat-containing protein [Planctomycetota bacterium]